MAASAAPLQIQSGNNEWALQERRSHVAFAELAEIPARRDPAAHLDRPALLNRKSGTVSRPGAIREFQFPESTDLRGRVKFVRTFENPKVRNMESLGSVVTSMLSSSEQTDGIK
jgi:hypothetical protein